VMTRDEAAAILRMPEDKAIDTILSLSERAEKYDKLCGPDSPTCPSGMKPPYLKPTVKKRRKKPGRKKGHPGAARTKPKKIDHYIEHTLECCPDCNKLLRKPIKSHKRYTIDIPPVEPKVTEHTVNGYWCSGCRKTVYPKVTEALPNSNLGVSMLIMTAWLHYWVGMSVHNIVKYLSNFWNFDVTPGGLTQAWKKLGTTLKPIYDQIGEEVRNTAVLHADETGWRIFGKTYWLWCFATGKWCYFTIDKSRGSPVILRVLGNFFRGVLVCDFWGAYNKIRTLATQRCFYHLLTALEKVDKANKSLEWKSFRKKLVRLVMDAVRLAEMKDTLCPEVCESRKTRLYVRQDLLIDSADRTDKDINRLIKRIIRHRNEFFTFLEFNGVSPYNNHAEQQIRRPVITRKISQQNRSNEGAKTHAIFMSLFRSAELQGYNPVEKVLLDLKSILSKAQKREIQLDEAA